MIFYFFPFPGLYDSPRHSPVGGPHYHDRHSVLSEPAAFRPHEPMLPFGEKAASVFGGSPVIGQSRLDLSQPRCPSQVCVLTAVKLIFFHLALWEGLQLCSYIPAQLPLFASGFLPNPSKYSRGTSFWKKLLVYLNCDWLRASLHRGVETYSWLLTFE